jgi:trimethylamine-N-oxide reductase (cytochrome c)
VLIDGWYYWIVRINPLDAAPRGIADGVLVKVFNGRGAVLCAARLTERIRPGTVHSYEGSAVLPPWAGPASPWTGRVHQLSTPSRMIISKSHSTASIPAGPDREMG